MKPESKVALSQLVTRPNIAVSFISGRPLSNLLKKVGLYNATATYSGNHGMEILFTNKTEFHYPIKPEIYENCTKLKQVLTEKVCMTTAVIIITFQSCFFSSFAS